MSLADRIRQMSQQRRSTILVSPDPEHPDASLYYRIIDLSKAVKPPRYSQGRFLAASYETEYATESGKIYEFQEGKELPESDNDKVLKENQVCRVNPNNYQGYFTFSFKEQKNAVKVWFSDNQRLNLSRIFLVDPDNRRYPLGTDGTLNSKQTWLLPKGTTFSMGEQSGKWHVELDAYSKMVFDIRVEKKDRR